MNSTIKIASLVAGSALAIGVGGVAATAGGEGAQAVSSTPEAPKAASIQGKLSNGKTYGYWAPSTPDDQRPDFMPVDLEDGKKGFLKVDEAFPPVDPRSLESSDEARQLRAKYMASKIQPDSKGEVWAPAYADDGTTVVGRVLISTREKMIE